MANDTGYFLTRSVLPVAAALVAVCLLPFELPVGMDISQILFTARTVIERGDIYGTGISLGSSDPRTFGNIGPFPYSGPPWSVPPLVLLGLFPPEKASAIWFVISVLLLCASAALITTGLSSRLRASIIIAALLSAPVQGHLIVGQTALFALIGAALVAAQGSHGSSLWMGIGFSLLSFRPHLGAPIVLLCGIGLLLLRRRGAFLRATVWTFGILISLTGVALWIDPACLVEYLDYLTALNALPSNKFCDTCSSIPVLLTGRSPTAPSSIWSERFVLWGAFFFALGYPLVRWCRSLPLIVAGAVCVALLSAPYNRNYDFVLLVLPLVIVGRQAINVSSAAGWKRPLIMALVATGALIAGVVPYGMSRAVQGDVLWLSAACGYLAVLLLNAAQRENL